MSATDLEIATAPAVSVGAVSYSGWAMVIVTVVAAVVAIWGIVTQRAIARKRATIDYIARLEADGDVIEARRKFNELERANEGGLAKFADRAYQGTEEMSRIRTVLNDFELVAVAIKADAMDYELYRNWLGSGTVLYWERAEPFILRLRQRMENPRIYKEFEALAKKLRSEM